MSKKAPEKIGSVLRVPLSQLHPHPQNPFAVRDDPAMQELKESVSQNGVLVPAIARPRAEGGYELIAGHRRKHACEQARQDSMPVIVLNLNDDEAVIQLVDSNIQREDMIFPDTHEAIIDQDTWDIARKMRMRKKPRVANGTYSHRLSSLVYYADCGARIVDTESLVPAEHLLRKIDAAINWNKLYDMVEPLYCEDNGRPSIDPVVLFKMVLIQHLYGLPSLRRTAEEIRANIYYRWFLGYRLQEETPHFSTISYNFKHLFQNSTAPMRSLA